MERFCSTRLLKNAKFLQSSEIGFFPEEEPLEGFHTLLDASVLGRIDQIPQEEIEIERLAEALLKRRPPTAQAELTAPLFSGAFRFVQATFSSSGTDFSVPAPDLDVAIKYAGLAVVPISEYCSQYGPNSLTVAQTTIPFNTSVDNGKYNDSILSGWVDQIAKAIRLGPDSCLVFLNPQGVVNTDADATQGVLGYHGMSSLGIPYAFVNVMGRGLTVEDQQDAYALALSHEIAEATVDPKADGSNYEVCDNCAGNCIPADEIILGDNKRISDYRTGDTIVGTVGRQLVNKTFSREYDGELIEMKALGMLPLRITPEHQIQLVRGLDDTRNITYGVPNWKPIDQAVPKLTRKDGDYIMMSQARGTITTGRIDLRPYVQAHLLSLRFPNKIRSVLPTWFPLSESTAWLLGMYVAEGCPHMGKRESSVHFVISDGEIPTASRIKKVCESLGLGVYSIKVKNERALHLRFRSVILARFFREVMGDSCYNKKIPDFILYNKNLKILRSFLTGYHEGDGSRSMTRGYDSYRFSTSSKVLALQLQLAYGRLGVFVALSHPRKECEGMIMGRKVHLHDQYVGGWGDHSNERLHNGTFLLPIKSLNRVKYRGVVYNLSTTDQTYLVSNMTVHNCNVDYRNYFDAKGNWISGAVVMGYAFFVDGIVMPANAAQCPAPQGSCTYPPPKPTNS